jgi:hypothetical protein
VHWDMLLCLCVGESRLKLLIYSTNRYLSGHDRTDRSLCYGPDLLNQCLPLIGNNAFQFRYIYTQCNYEAQKILKTAMESRAIHNN